MRDRPPKPVLRPSERRVLQLASRGYTRRQTATELRYSYPYVRELAAAACQRLGAKNVTEAVAMAVRAGLI